MLSDAFAITCTVPLTLAPAAGEAIETVGAVVSGTGFKTVTWTGAEVVIAPAVSRATAVRECVPFVAPVVFHDMLKGATVTSLPRRDPSSWNCTPAMPMGDDALA